jgi:hypothetical protein
MGNVNKMKEKWANKEAKVWFMEAQKWTQQFPPWKVLISHHQNSRVPIPDFPKWEISRHVASLNRTVQIYLRGFHHGKSRSLITRTPEFPIPDFPKWEIS